MKIKTEESDESEEESSALLLQRKWEVKRQLQRKSPARATSPTHKSPARATSPKNKVPDCVAGEQRRAGCCVGIVAGNVYLSSTFSAAGAEFPSPSLLPTPDSLQLQGARRDLEDLRRIKLHFVQKSNKLAT